MRRTPEVAVILPDGTVADHASVALARLRRDIERQKKSIQDSLERFLKAHREEGILQEVKRRRFYEKPSVKRKRKMREARKRRRREMKRRGVAVK